MLGKLLKYELQGTALYFLPLFAATLVFSILIRLCGSVFDYNWGWINGLLIFVEVLLIITLAVMTLVITIRRFYLNLLGNEGYLMFTLPVSTHHNILSKLLVAMLWTIAGMLVVALSIIIMAGFGNIAADFSSAWRDISNFLLTELNLSPFLLLCEFAIIGLIGVASNILFLYLAMAIGQLANEHKFLASIGAFLGLQVALSIISSTIIANLSLAWINDASYWIETFKTPGGIMQLVQIIMLASAIIGITTSVAYYFITHWLLKRRLNLS